MATPENIYFDIRAIDNTKEGFSSVRTGLRGVATEAAKTTKATEGATNSVANMGRKAGAAGIQIQQLVGQIQGGTNPMLALSQQAADLGIVLGAPLIGAVAGLAASFAMVLLPSLFDTEESMADIIKLMDKLNESTKTLTENQIIAKEQGFDEQIAAMEELKKAAEENLGKFRSANIEGVLTPEDVKRMNELKGTIDTYAQGIKDLEAQKAKLRNTDNEHADEIKKLIATMQEEAETVGMTATQLAVYRARQLGAEDADIERIQTLGMVVEAYDAALEKDKEIAAFKEQYQKDQKAANEQMLKDQESATAAMAKNLKPIEDGLVGLISGTKSASDAFRDMARSIIEDLIRMQIQSSITQPLSKALSGFDIFSFFGGTSSGTPATNIGAPASIAASAGAITHNALGGSVSAGQPTIVGEHGREMFIPNTDGQIVPNDKVGGGVTIVQNINVSTGVSQTVRAEIANLMPQISNAAKSAVADARQRGGGFSKAMGV